MGYYIETGTNHDKAEIICAEHDGTMISQPTKFSDVPSDKGLVCVVDNGAFEAAAFCYNQHELVAFTLARDTRPKKWLLIDKQKAKELSNCQEV